MNFNSIRVRYTTTFCALAAVFLVQVLMGFTLVSKMESGMVLFGKNFNPAISAVINADRDLYQSRVAELEALYPNVSPEIIESARNDFNENAQQALDRMNKYKRFMKDYPEMLSRLSSFDDAYGNWIAETDKVFTLVSSGQVEQAKAQSHGESLSAFNALRDYYDIAGEMADKKSAETMVSTSEQVGSSQLLLAVVSILIVGATLVVGIVAPRTMTNALTNLADEIKRLNSGNGDLTRRINSERTDEVGELANEIDELFDGLTALIRSIVEQSSNLISGVDELNNGAQHVKYTSQQQTSSVDAIATAVNEMSYAIKEVAQNAQLTADEVNQVNQLTVSGTEITTKAVEEIESLSETVNQATEVIQRLSANSTDIASVLDVIRGIAEQTNLLALNAAIEAARAGEQGRGFAVVADEVRTLAARTQQSTEDIQKMIETLQSGVNEAVNAINLGNSATQSSVELSQQTLSAFEQIASASNRVIEASSQTATATEEQSQVAADVSQNITELSDQTTSNFETAEQNGIQAQETMAFAQSLSNSVTKFKLD